MALRVLWFYNLFTRQPPTIVVHLLELSEGNKAFAGIMGAVRVLAESGFQIIVDSSTHAAPIDLLRTGREIVALDYMSAAMVSRMDKYKSLFGTLQKYALVSLVWEVFGGLPSTLEKLCTASVDPDPEEAILKVLWRNIRLAEVECVTLFKEHRNEEFFHHFKNNNEMHLKSAPTWAATDTRVFRINKVCYVVPKSSFVLHNQHIENFSNVLPHSS